MPLLTSARAHRMSDRGWVVGMVEDEPCRSRSVPAAGAAALRIAPTSHVPDASGSSFAAGTVAGACGGGGLNRASTVVDPLAVAPVSRAAICSTHLLPALSDPALATA